MPRYLSLPLFAALAAGCATPPLDRPLAEFRPGVAPATAEVRYDAVHDLVRTDAPAVLHSTRLVRGERAGFREEADGTVVAVARGRAIPVGDGEFAWVVPPAARPGWRQRFACDCREVGSAVGGAAVVVGVFTAEWLPRGLALFHH